MFFPTSLFKSSLIVLGLVFFMAFRWLDDDFSQQVLEKIKTYREMFPQEKAYLHLDKSTYIAGDTLWFRAYLAEGAGHQIDSVSRVVYVDLVEKQSGKIMTVRQIRMEEAAGRGDIPLPDSLRAGFYTVRAYTNWMRNFSDDFFFQKDIRVVRTGEEMAATAAVTPAPDVQFFPEGGQLVAGLQGRVGFKAIDASGLGVDVEGFILNQKNDTISGFSSKIRGMGLMNFKPMPDQRYKAMIKRSDGSFATYDFPAVQPEGYVMMVDNVSNPNTMRVFIYNNRPTGVTGQLTLLGHTRGLVAFAAKGDVTRKSFIITIPKKELTEGILHLTLFNENNKPVCERLAFINHQNQLKIAVKPSKQVYAPREKTEVELMVTDSAGQPVQTTLSVAAVDAAQAGKTPFEMNMVSYMLLTSDLKGYVEEPSYYLDGGLADAKINVDILMMTQGWRRFRWEDVFVENLPTPSYFVEQSLVLKGKVMKLNRKEPGEVDLSLILTIDGAKAFSEATTDASGDFLISGLTNQDTARVLIQAATKKGNKSLLIEVDEFSAPKAQPKPLDIALFLRNNLDKERQKKTQEYLDIERQIRQNREKLLQEVVIKGKKEKEPDSRKLYTRADATITPNLGMTAGALTIFDMLRGRVAGLQITGAGQNVTVQIRGSTNLSGVVEPLFLLDGMPVDKEAMYSISVQDVESIDVLKGPSAAIYGSRGGGGVIAVLTKRGNSNYDYTQEASEGVKVVKMPGFSREREFYAPKYDVVRPEHVRPDFRSTLLWMPMVKTNAEGKATISYYNSDAATDVLIQAEGLTWQGLPGSTTATYQVR
ncbi:TonB-dependent receptor plug domain-containing protein [Arundinibacter roseus]|uniref:TonB-dependent receptor n=1 Tax=Arundinibacter roseus TaxID=2070510 RepID=A0A4R4K905_9BACT|nr:TonB-dependent receptor plug domain-containing protein [Arundinibacter roseus]TDB64168.1 TonB-dependent receptor [Arundinibacter roseus]